MTKTIHFPHKGRRENPKPDGRIFEMANITFTKKALVVRGGAGRAATEPLINVSEYGQVSFNKLSLAAMRDKDGKPYTFALWGTDAEGAGDKRKVTTCQLRCIATPAKFPYEIKNKAGKVVASFEEAELAHINWSKKGDSANVTCSQDFKAIGYDFKASGGQAFKCAVDGSSVTWEVPVGSLPKREVKHRESKPKVSKANSAVAPEVAKQVASELDEMVLS